MSDTKVSAILLEGKHCLLVELHWEGSAPAACAADLLANPRLDRLDRLKHETVCRVPTRTGQCGHLNPIIAQ